MRTLATVAVVIALVAGCGGSEDSAEGPPIGIFVGELTGSEAFVAVVAGKKNVAAYACDGGQGIAELWTGQRSDGSVELTSRGGAKLSASIDADGSAGTVTLPGTGQLDFSAEPAKGRAGFYRVAKTVDGRRVNANWVVLNDGRQRGSIAGSNVTTATRSASIPSLGTAAVTFVTPRGVSRAGFNTFSSFGG